jgi:hypothetical protein
MLALRFDIPPRTADAQRVPEPAWLGEHAEVEVAAIDTFQETNGMWVRLEITGSTDLEVAKLVREDIDQGGPGVAHSPSQHEIIMPGGPALDAPGLDPHPVVWPFTLQKNDGVGIGPNYRIWVQSIWPNHVGIHFQPVGRDPIPVHKKSQYLTLSGCRRQAKKSFALGALVFWQNGPWIYRGFSTGVVTFPKVNEAVHVRVNGIMRSQGEERDQNRRAWAKSNAARMFAEEQGVEAPILTTIWEEVFLPRAGGGPRNPAPPPPRRYRRRDRHAQ